MAESLSIRERIERVLVARITAITGIGTVERWSPAGNAGGHLSAVIYLDEESAEEGSTQTTHCTLPVRVELLIALARADAGDAMKVHNRWLGKIKAALLADRNLVESVTVGLVTTNTPLAVDVRYTGADEPHTGKGQPELFVVASFEVVYDEKTTDPYTAPGIALRTE